MYKENKRVKQHFILKKLAEEEKQGPVIDLGRPFGFILEKKNDSIIAFCF